MYVPPVPDATSTLPLPCVPPCTDTPPDALVAVMLTAPSFAPALSIATVSCAPTSTPPSAWLAVIFTDDDDACVLSTATVPELPTDTPPVLLDTVTLPPSSGACIVTPPFSAVAVKSTVDACVPTPSIVTPPLACVLRTCTALALF